MSEDQLKIKLLQEEWASLEKSLETLNLSVDKCSILFGKRDYTFEEMESFDSLTSMFGRTSDLFTQKILRTLWMLLHEPFVPFIDLLNKAEKLEIIHSADDVLKIRDLRNQITHEYIPEAITDMIPDVMEETALLRRNIQMTRQFIMKRDWMAKSDE